MTMPDERTRAIRWGGELLISIASDTELPDTQRETARNIGEAYPTPGDLLELIEQDTPIMPLAWADALAASLVLFLGLRYGGQGSQRTRRELVYTLRHFPEDSTIELFARGGHLTGWLAPEKSVI